MVEVGGHDAANPGAVVEALTAVDDAMPMSATDLDYGIWDWQRRQRGR